MKDKSPFDPLKRAREILKAHPHANGNELRAMLPSGIELRASPEGWNLYSGDVPFTDRACFVERVVAAMRLLSDYPGVMPRIVHYAEKILQEAELYAQDVHIKAENSK